MGEFDEKVSFLSSLAPFKPLRVSGRRWGAHMTIVGGGSAVQCVCVCVCVRVRVRVYACVGACIVCVRLYVCVSAWGIAFAVGTCCGEWAGLSQEGMRGRGEWARAGSWGLTRAMLPACSGE